MQLRPNLRAKSKSFLKVCLIHEVFAPAAAAV
jgi:hypothetical protein